MTRIVQNNCYFFTGFILFIIIGAIFLFQLNPGEEILFFSKNRTFTGDLFFKFITKAGEHYIYILSVFIFIFVRFRYAVLFPLIGLLVTLLTSLSKSFFKHPRPLTFYTDNQLIDTLNVVEGVKMVQGHSSFPSGHTMSAFALFAILAFLTPYKKSTAFAFLFVAVLVGISRIYLIQHFLKDVYLGAIMGTLLAMVIFYAQKRWTSHWLNGALDLSKVLKSPVRNRP